MSSSIYEEALADVRKLKEVAEQNAKNAIIDAVTPKIRDMIEKQLIGDTHSADGNVLSDLAESILADDADDVSLTSESLRALSNFVNSENSFSAKDAELCSLLIQERLLVIMDDAGDVTPDTATLVEIKNEIVRTYEQLVENRSGVKNADFNRIQKRLASLDHFLNEAIGEKEMNERDLRSILDEEALRLVLDLGDEVEGLDLDAIDVTLEPAEVEEEEEEVVDIEADGDELDVVAAEEEVLEGVTPAEEATEAGTAARMAASGEAGGVGPDAAGDATLGESDSADDEVLEINEDQLANMIRSILNEDDADESFANRPASSLDGPADEDLDESADEDLDEDDGADEDSKGELDESLTDDTVVEISESMLRDELSRMRRLRESATPTTTTESNNNEGTSDEVAQLKTQLREYQKAVSSLRGQLDESNLFNAKLLYANKLLQGQGLSDRQRVNIVESLDNAKSLREVRLLYKSLVESVNANKGGLTESKRRQAAGSASRPTRTGSVSSEYVPEADRWALLAGLNK